MKQLSAVQLYLILTWAQAEEEDGHWDKSTAGRYYQYELNAIISYVQKEIQSRDFSEMEFQKKYIEIFREAPNGHYIPN